MAAKTGIEPVLIPKTLKSVEHQYARHDSWAQAVIGYASVRSGRFELPQVFALVHALHKDTIVEGSGGVSEQHESWTKNDCLQSMRVVSPRRIQPIRLNDFEKHGQTGSDAC